MHMTVAVTIGTLAGFAAGVIFSAFVRSAYTREIAKLREDLSVLLGKVAKRV